MPSQAGLAFPNFHFCYLSDQLILMAAEAAVMCLFKSLHNFVYRQTTDIIHLNYKILS